MPKRHPLNAFAAAVIALSALAALPSARAAGNPSFEAQLFGLINDYRTTNGVAALWADSRLHDMALSHATDMAVNGCFSHDACDGTPAHVRRAAFYPSPIVIDLIAAGFPSAASVLDGWKSSTLHNAALLDPTWLGGGVGYFHVDTGMFRHYWTLGLGGLPAPVPEPGTWALMIGGGVLLAMRTRRRA